MMVRWSEHLPKPPGVMFTQGPNGELWLTEEKAEQARKDMKFVEGIGWGFGFCYTGRDEFGNITGWFRH